MAFVFGVLAGVAIGFMIGCYGAAKRDQKAVKEKVIVLEGKTYGLIELRRE